jgi:TRAP-type C4-dicarboxylate transport system substrate-binding protein
MNKDTYNRLPDDVKAIIEEMNADGRYALKAAKGFQDIYDATLKTFVAEGGKYIDWNKEEKAELDKLAASIWEEWIKTQESRGIEVKKVIDAYYNGLKALGVENPALGYRP